MSSSDQSTVISNSLWDNDIFDLSEEVRDVVSRSKDLEDEQINELAGNFI
jgi:hypothetical protein